MLSLDPMTVERVAKLVCDPGGPYERSGRDLEKLLGRSAWADPPAYDGSPRVPGWPKHLKAGPVTKRRSSGFWVECVIHWSIWME